MVRTLSNSLTRRSLTGWLTPSCARVSACASSAARFTACPMVCANTATRIATPSRKPSWRAVFSMPEPAPLWPPGTALIPAASSAGSERPMPAPTRALRQTTPLTGAVRARCPRATSPAAVTRAPVTAEPARPDAVGEPAGGRREDHDGDREGGDREPGLELAVVHHRDHEDHAHEHRAHHRGVDGHDGGGGRGEGAVAEAGGGRTAERECAAPTTPRRGEGRRRRRRGRGRRPRPSPSRCPG